MTPTKGNGLWKGVQTNNADQIYNVNIKEDMDKLLNMLEVQSRYLVFELFLGFQSFSQNSSFDFYQNSDWLEMSEVC